MEFFYISTTLKKTKVIQKLCHKYKGKHTDQNYKKTMVKRYYSLEVNVPIVVLFNIIYMLNIFYLFTVNRLPLTFKVSCSKNVNIKILFL